jgi:hypothetical protein
VAASSTTQVSAAEYGAGVDGDAVVADDGGFYGRVAVYDDGAEVGFRIEEGLAGAEQVVAGLAFQGDAGADAGVDEGVAAFPVDQLQIAQEILMGLGDFGGPLVSWGFGVDAVTL